MEITVCIEQNVERFLKLSTSFFLRLKNEIV